MPSTSLPRATSARIIDAMPRHLLILVALLLASCSGPTAYEPHNVIWERRDPVEAEKSLQLAERALADDKGNALFHLTRARALSALERFDTAIAACDEAIRLKPDYASAYFERAVIRLRHDYFSRKAPPTRETVAEAEADMRTAIRHDPSWLEPARNMLPLVKF